jgi:hypothetical protein
MEGLELMRADATNDQNAAARKPSDKATNTQNKPGIPPMAVNLFV